MLVTQFDKFVNRSTQEILGGEIVREDLTPMISISLQRDMILTDLIATENGLYIPPQGVDGFRQVLVDVSPNLDELVVTSNGIYIPSGVDGYSKVSVNVPNTYTNADEGKVVKNGELVSQTARSSDITQNGIYDTTDNNSVNVNVPNTYTNADEGKVVENGALTPQTSRPNDITQNGIYDTTLYNSINVNVANSGILNFDFTQSFTDTLKNYTASAYYVNITNNGATFQNDYARIRIPIYAPFLTYEIEVGELRRGSNHTRFLMYDASNGFIYRNAGYWTFYRGSWDTVQISDFNFFNNSTVKLVIDIDYIWHIYKNDVLVISSQGACPPQKDGSLYPLFIGSGSGDSLATGSTIKSLKVY